MCVWYEPRTGRVARNAWHVDSWIRIDGSSRARMNRMRSSGNVQRAVARVYTYLDGGIACPCFRWIRKKGMKGTFGCVSGDLMCNGLYAFFIYCQPLNREGVYFDLAIIYDPLGILIHLFEHYVFSFISRETKQTNLFFFRNEMILAVTIKIF